MKNLKFLLLAFFLLEIGGAAIAQDNPKTMNPPDGKAIIYIIRLRDQYGMFRSVNKIDGTELPTLGSRDFVYMVVDPGDHKVVCKGSTKESTLDIKAEAGKKYYVIQRAQVLTWGVYWTKISEEKDPKKGDKTLQECTEAKFKETK